METRSLFWPISIWRDIMKSSNMSSCKPTIASSLQELQQPQVNSSKMHWNVLQCRPSWTCVLFHVVITHSLPSLGRILLNHFFLLPHHPTESSSCVLLQQQQYKPNACCDWIAKAVYLMIRREEHSGEPNIDLLDCKGYVHRVGIRILGGIGYGSWFTN